MHPLSNSGFPHLRAGIGFLISFDATFSRLDFDSSLLVFFENSENSFDPMRFEHFLKLKKRIGSINHSRSKSKQNFIYQLTESLFVEKGGSELLYQIAECRTLTQ